MSKRKVPLLKISDYSSIYFDFEEKVPYIQWFKGYNVDEHTSGYSKSNTFWFSQIILVSGTIVGLILDSIFSFPIILSIFLSTLLGIMFGKILVSLLINRFLSNREYRKVGKDEVISAISNTKKIYRVWLIEIFLVIFMLIGLLPMIDHGMKGKDFIMWGIGVFVITLIHESIHPRLTLKARKILKKQLKEGKFDD